LIPVWQIVADVQVPLALSLSALVIAKGQRSRLRWPLVIFLLLGYAVGNIVTLARSLGFATDRTIYYNALLAEQVAVFGSFAFYLMVIGGSVASPLARPFRPRSVWWGLAWLAMLLAVFAYLDPQAWDPSPVFQGGQWVAYGTNPEQALFKLFALTISTYGIIVAVHAFLLAKPGALRRRAAWYALAFGLQDLAFLLGNFGGLVNLSDIAQNLISNSLWLGTLLILPYAMLRDQLFDIDLRLKLALKGSTIGAAFLAVFFIVAQLVQNIATQELGYVVGAIAAGGLLFLLKPLERMAERLSDRAMPRTTGTPEYVAFRKLEVYKAAVESAHETGGITARERASLDRLRAKLSIAEADAARIESDVIAGPTDVVVAA
jgi:hypothetical protein